MSAPDDLRRNGDFARPFKPMGMFKSSEQKYFSFVFSEAVIYCRHPASSKRDVRVVTLRGGGLRWT